MLAAGALLDARASASPPASSGPGARPNMSATSARRTSPACALGVAHYVALAKLHAAALSALSRLAAGRSAACWRGGDRAPPRRSPPRAPAGRPALVGRSARSSASRSRSASGRHGPRPRRLEPRERLLRLDPAVRAARGPAARRPRAAGRAGRRRSRASAAPRLGEQRRDPRAQAPDRRRTAGAGADRLDGHVIALGRPRRQRREGALRRRSRRASSGSGEEGEADGSSPLPMRAPAPATPASAGAGRGLRALRPCPYVAASRAPVAQLDRAPDYESGGRRFESFRARHFPTSHDSMRRGFAPAARYRSAPEVVAASARAQTCSSIAGTARPCEIVRWRHRRRRRRKPDRFAEPATVRLAQATERVECSITGERRLAGWPSRRPKVACRRCGHACEVARIRAEGRPRSCRRLSTSAAPQEADDELMPKWLGSAPARIKLRHSLPGFMRGCRPRRRDIPCPQCHCGAWQRRAE